MDQEFGTATKLIKGAGGVFEVKVDGESVFSKAALGRFPDPDEVATSLRER